MKRVKKAVAVVLTGVMLCGAVVTANAADGHAHVFGEPGTAVCYNSFSSGTHTYVKPDGSTGTCTILVNQYRAVKTCGCGATEPVYWTVVQHTGCGQ